MAQNLLELETMLPWTVSNLYLTELGKAHRRCFLLRQYALNTPNANMADHSDGPGLVAWKRG